MHRFLATMIAALATLGLAAPAGAHHPEGDGLDPLQAATAHHQHGATTAICRRCSATST